MQRRSFLVLTSLALLLIGFSVFSALTIALTHFRRQNYLGQGVSRVMGLVLLMALSGLQIAHFAHLYLDQDWVSSMVYRMTMFAVAPAFFLFSQPLLQRHQLPPLRPVMLLHALPVFISLILPSVWALSCAFMVGSGYLVWLARSLDALRQDRIQFQLERRLLGAVFVIAIGVAVLALVQAALPEKTFFVLYAIAIGLAFFLVQTTLVLRPKLSTEVSETVQQSAYTISTLSHVDCDEVLVKLNSLMQTQQIYVDSALNLPRLAQRLGLSAHQLSEFINARMGKGFSRYLREQRVQAAKTMLCKEPSASILSVGLNVGFTSPSNFYDAFREIEGMTPGQYRKLGANKALA